MSHLGHLTERNISEIAQIIGHEATSLRDHLTEENFISGWTVTQCKNVIRYIREKYPSLNHITLTGRKADLVRSAHQALNYSPKNRGYNGWNTPNIDVPKLVEHTKFKQNRCPFIIDWQNLMASGVVSGNTSQFRLKLQPEQVKQLHKPRRDRTIGLHLRLFSSAGNHESWNNVAATGVCVYINKTFITISGSKNKAGVKKRGYHVAKPLDISNKAQEIMEIEILCQTHFTGVCVAELATFHSFDDMITNIIRRCKGIPASEKKCQICDHKEELMRCSRCKTAWYCGEEHQQRHWPYHQRLCKPYKSKPKLPRIGGDKVDEDIQIGESRVSLRCPLTIKRIDIPVRGINCNHPQCFDLRGFLNFCAVTGVWQCPVCTNACQFKDLGIDDEMDKILKNTSDEIDQVRLFPNGKYEPITLEEIRAEHANPVQNGKGKKRKREDGDEPPTKKAGATKITAIELD